jgi:putative membrane protein
MLAFSQGWMQGPMHDMGWMGGWFGWLWLLLSFGFFLLLAGALIALIRYFWTRSGPETGRGSALDILKERYARGEIGREEYQRMRQELQ